MKKFYYLLASMAFVLVVITACEKSAIGVDEIQTVKDDVLLSKGEKDPKVTICHYDADLGESYQITISANGLNGHDGHLDDNIPEFDGEVYTPLLDTDLDGIIDCADCYPDDGTRGEKMTWYQDADGDGFGNPDVYIKTCLVRDGYVDNADDCDDTTAAILGEYIFEWSAPNGYKHYVNIDSYNPADGTFTGSGYFIFISHSSGWAVGNEPLTVSGTYNKDGKTFVGILDYTNNGTAGFSGTVSGCDGLTGTNILIYPYVDNDGDGFSIEEGDCDDGDANLFPYSLVGNYTFRATYLTELYDFTVNITGNEVSLVVKIGTADLPGWSQTSDLFLISYDEVAKTGVLRQDYTSGCDSCTRELTFTVSECGGILTLEEVDDGGKIYVWEVM